MAKGKSSSGIYFLVLGIIFLLVGMGLFVGLYVGITKKITDAKSKINKQKKI